MLPSLLVLAALALPDGDLFIDVAAEAGLDFVHFNGMSGELYFPEMMGPGAAFLDYDGDGDLDAYMVQGAMLGPGKTLKDALFPPRGPLPPRGRLYRNDLIYKDGHLFPRFVDVTAASGLDAREYGMAAATGDFDGDGWTDLYLANLGPDQLWRNRGDGTFEDVTARSGTADPRWGAGASFLDFDRDGWLDLYVVDYVEFDLAKNPRCFAPSSRRDYCGPADFPPQPDSLWRNRGDGTFEDVSTRAGIAGSPQPGLGVVAFDADGDGWTDLYVANDGTPNQLWLNRRDGTFRDEAVLAGVAVNRAGRPEASMGVDAGDLDGDGDEDLFMTHLTGETNTLYVNEGGGLFEDRSLETGAALGTLPFTSFGTLWSDLDNDGWLDLFIANGAVRILEELAAKGDPFPLAQTSQLYRNVGGRLEEVSARAGAVFRQPMVARGAAFGDVDQDGDDDVLLAVANGPARLLRNEMGHRRPWLGLVLTDRRGRNALGARVEVLRRDARPLARRVHTDGGYASAHDPRVRAGLGEAPATAVRVRWPDGKVSEWQDPPTGRYLVIRQGEERPR